MDRPARLTTAFVKEVEEPGRYGDGRGGFGLSLLVRPTRDGLGKNWQQRLTVTGKPRSLGLGSFPQVSLSRARTLAVGNATTIRERFPRRSGLDRLLAETADLQAVPTVTDGPTFADVAEESIELRRTSWKPGSKTEAQTRSLLARYVNPVLGDIAIDQVTPALVLEVLTPIWHEKAETGRKVKRNIQAVFNFAIGKGYLVTISKWRGATADRAEALRSSTPSCRMESHARVRARWIPLLARGVQLLLTDASMCV